ncbi:hypothetical protein Lepto1548_07180 [Leptospira interrogans serovar Bataviae]|nr:hypothetical protein Lepto1548_07180 [Leptospira interrogans serovar Bataviae]
MGELSRTHFQIKASRFYGHSAPLLWIVRRIVFYNKLNLVKDFVLNRTLNLLIGVESRVWRHRIHLNFLTPNLHD